jgi:hypothetical protein
VILVCFAGAVVFELARRAGVIEAWTERMIVWGMR